MICSGWPDHLMAKLLDLVTQKSLPVVLIDRNPPPELADIPAKISYVSVSDAAGGQLAADAVLELLDGAPIRRILVVAGFANRNRHDSFHKRIKSSKKLSGCEVVVTEDGKFDRWIAENVTFNLLSDALKAKKPFEVIFCTADSMTVGCLTRSPGFPDGVAAQSRASSDMTRHRRRGTWSKAGVRRWCASWCRIRGSLRAPQSSN